MRRILDFVARHHEPVQRWEFNLVAAVGISVFAITLFAVGYVRVMERNQAESLSPSWEEASPRHIPSSPERPQRS